MCFRAHIRAARLAGVPLRSMPATPMTMSSAILREEREEGGAFDFLLHCFSSGRALAEAAIEMGGYVSFSGILTFPKARSSGTSRAIFPPTGCWSRPTRPTSRRCRSAASATSRRMGRAHGGELAEVRGMTPERSG